MIRIFSEKIMVILVFFFIQIQSPFIGKLLIIGVIIYTLAYIQFLKQRIHLISITVSSVERLRSYKILRDRIIKIVEKEFQKSLSFLLYRNYRIFVYRILQDQRELAEQDRLINPLKPLTKVFTLRIFQVNLANMNDF